MTHLAKAAVSSGRPLDDFIYATRYRPSLIHAAAFLVDYETLSKQPGSDGIAVIDIRGPLTMEMSGRMQSYREIVADVEAAVEDAAVKGIMLRINSPGGETDGAFETATRIREIGAIKPVWAVAEVAAYSAAYLIASAASKIYAAATSGGVGSIGVYTEHLDFSERLALDGIKVTLISSGEGKVEGHPAKPLEASAAADLRAEVNRLNDQFVADVSRWRKIPEKQIRGYESKPVNGSRDAIEKGLADESGSFRTAMIAMKAAIAKRGMSRVALSVATKGKVNRMDKERFSESVDETTSAGVASGTEFKASVIYVETIAEAAERGRAAGYAEAAEIVELCELAGTPISASEFLAACTPVGKVRSALYARRKTASSGEIVSIIKPETSTTAPRSNVLMDAMKKLGEKI